MPRGTTRILRLRTHRELAPGEVAATVSNSREILDWRYDGPVVWQWPLNESFQRVHPKDLDDYAQTHLIFAPRCPCAIHADHLPPAAYAYVIMRVLDPESPHYGKIKASCQRDRCQISYYFDDYFNNEEHRLAIYPKSTMTLDGFYTPEHRRHVREMQGIPIIDPRLEVMLRPRPRMIQIDRKRMLRVSEFYTPEHAHFGHHLRFWEPPASLTLAFTPMSQLPIPANIRQLVERLVSGPGITAHDLMHILDRCDDCDKVMARDVIATHTCQADPSDDNLVIPNPPTTIELNSSDEEEHEAGEVEGVIDLTVDA
ncbi:hypothetical protein SISSUDRAFT_1067671 [Sistotremastrum suecicum HHB10207 ss-3]|uniref:Uncharacterized protein n=1 Tax=Sistotremastrum suecicum HHB10207 ss-3 TaxID=1314776 RepID=A0A165WUY3_9AGAM|nr:hypothetical protein SISSUDRAFT_1067671 [Sistotremastrum suecicum HHB10207 ss-3]